MNAKIPPDIVLLSCGILMWLQANYIPQFGLRIPYHAVLSGITLLSGLVIIFLAKIALYKYRTTERADRRSLSHVSVLVTSGVYSFSRNPIYLGMAVLLIGWAVILMNWFSVMGVFVFAWFITRFQIMPEEKALEHVFGDEYRQYRSRVRRWI